MGFAQPGSSLAGFKEKLGTTLCFTHTLLAERIPLDAARRRSEDLVKKMIGARDSR